MNNDRLSHLDEILKRLYQQLAGLENTLITASPEEKVRLYQRIEDQRLEIRKFEEEKEQLQECATQEPENMTPSQPNPIVFHNQEKALNQVRGSVGNLVVLDALPGYGKTAFLEKLREEYQERPRWHCGFIRLERGQTTLVEFFLLILNGLGDDISFASRRITDLSETDVLNALVNCLQKWNKEVCIALFIDDVDYLDRSAFDCLKYKFCEGLKGLLSSATYNQFLLIFSGRNLRQNGDWSITESNYVYLTPFQRVTIGHFLDEARLPQLQNALTEATYRTRNLFIDRIYRLTGGHPRASIRLIEALQTREWQPLRMNIGTLVRDRDFEAFQAYVVVELARLTEGLENTYIRYFPTLLVFRILHSSIVKAVRQKEEFSDSCVPLTFIQALTSRNLAAQEGATIFHQLNPVLRQGRLAQMILSQDPQEKEIYRDLHHFAQQVYQTLNFDNDDPERVHTYIRESLYHCLCLYSNDENPSPNRQELLSALKQCLHQGLQVLDRLDPEDQEEVQSVLLRLIQRDEEITALLQEHELKWSDVVTNAIDSFTSSPQFQRIIPGGGIDSQYQSQEQAKALTIALLDDNGKVKGTGFWVRGNAEGSYPQVLTCAHVVKELNKQEGGLLRGRTFGPDPQEITLEVVWYQIPNDRPEDWSAQEDIAILRMVQPEVVIPSLLFDLNLDPQMYLKTQSMMLYSFGFPSTKHLKGESFNNLIWDGQVGNGFAKLINLGKTKVEPGASGSPLVDLMQRQIIGMIQARSSNDVVYCIPARSLAQILHYP
jgi:hypothetical protein